MRKKLLAKLIVFKIIFIAILVIYAGRLLLLQVVDQKKYAAAAGRQHNLIIDLQAKRGTIYDCN